MFRNEDIENMEENSIIIKTTMENVDSFMEDVKMADKSHEELKKILDLIFENTGYAYDEFHLTMKFDGDLMAYLKVAYSDRYNKRLAELKERN